MITTIFRTPNAVLSIVFVTLCTIGVPFCAFGQKIGYINTDFILSKMPEQQKAQAEIDGLAAKWQEEIQALQQSIDEKYSELKVEEVLLTQEMRKERVKEIEEQEKTLKEYQQKVFGFEGLFYLKKQELMKPLQDEVFDAVEKVAKQNKLQFVFDKAGDIVMIYTDPIHDYTDYVLDELGLGEEEDTAR